MLFEVPTPEQYKEANSKNGVWTTGSLIGYNVMVKYWEGKKTTKIIKKQKKTKLRKR